MHLEVECECLQFSFWDDERRIVLDPAKTAAAASTAYEQEVLCLSVDGLSASCSYSKPLGEPPRPILCQPLKKLAPGCFACVAQVSYQPKHFRQRTNGKVSCTVHDACMDTHPCADPHCKRLGRIMCFVSLQATQLPKHWICASQPMTSSATAFCLAASPSSSTHSLSCRLGNQAHLYRRPFTSRCRQPSPRTISSQGVKGLPSQAESACPQRHPDSKYSISMISGEWAVCDCCRCPSCSRVLLRPWAYRGAG